MDELQYRETYRSVNDRRCHFEKSINARMCTCCHMQRFNLADREGVHCGDVSAHSRCLDWLRTLRQASRFALELPALPDILPHRLEAKVQAGGMRELAEALDRDAATPDIAELLDEGQRQFGALANFPLPEIVTAVAECEPRRKRKRQVVKRR